MENFIFCAMKSVFDCIAKMHAYVFAIKSLKFIDNYQAGRKEMVKINLK